jgi:Lon protease-like protein
VTTELPLFPLGTVLLPRGRLPLRIFETRYTDMVRRCMRESQPFGVVLISAGSEVGEIGATHAIGTAARIVDFSTLDDGLLGIQCQGERRFQLRRGWRQPDGLNMGEVDWLPEWVAGEVPVEIEPLLALLKQNWAELATHFDNEAPRFHDSVWVCARLAQVLPLPMPLRQQLLESDSAAAALGLLATVVKPEQPNA